MSAGKNDREILALAGQFNRSTGNLLRMFENRARTDDDFNAVKTIRDRLHLLKNYGGPETPLINSAPILFAFSDVITSADAEERDKFILHVDIEAEKDARKIVATREDLELVIGLIAVIRRHYAAAPAKVRGDAVAEIQAMLEYSISYLLLA